MFGWFNEWVAISTRFPTDKNCTSAVHVAYNAAFLPVAFPLQLLGLPHWPQLVAGWGIFLYGMLRYWLRDHVLDDTEVPRLLAEQYTWFRWLGVVLINLIVGFIWLFYLVGAKGPPVGLLPGAGLLTSMAAMLAVELRTVRGFRRRQKLPTGDPLSAQ